MSSRPWIGRARIGLLNTMFSASRALIWASVGLPDSRSLRKGCTVIPPILRHLLGGHAKFWARDYAPWERNCREQAMLRQQSRQFSGKVTSQVPLQYDPNFRISTEITLQRFNLPTQCADRLNCHRIHISRGAAQQQYRACDVTRNQVTEDTFVC